MSENAQIDLLRKALEEILRLPTQFIHACDCANEAIVIAKRALLELAQAPPESVPAVHPCTGGRRQGRSGRTGFACD